jgi:flagellar protein FliJ
MTTNQSERSHRREEFEANHNRGRAKQIETMIADFDRICIDLGQQIEAEEIRVQIYDPMHIAYPTYAKAARERRANIQRSTDALRRELDHLRLSSNEHPGQQFAA